MDSDLDADSADVELNPNKLADDQEQEDSSSDGGLEESLNELDVDANEGPSEEELEADLISPTPEERTGAGRAAGPADARAAPDLSEDAPDVGVARPAAHHLSAQKARQRWKYQQLNRLRLNEIRARLNGEPNESRQLRKAGQLFPPAASAPLTTDTSAGKTGSDVDPPPHSATSTSSSATSTSATVGAQIVEAPKIAAKYSGRVRENERLVELEPKLRILNRAEVCDIELSWPDVSPGEAQEQRNTRHELPFVVSWIDRIAGEATLEARNEELMNCERRRNFTFQMRAIGCNGLNSNE